MWLFATFLLQHPSLSQQIASRVWRVMSTFCEVSRRVSDTWATCTTLLRTCVWVRSRRAGFRCCGLHLVSLLLRWETADAVLIVLSFSFQQGRNEGGKGDTIPREEREKQILLHYYKIMFGMTSPTLHHLISKMYKDLSPHMLRNSLYVQIPLAKKNILLTHFFEKLLVCGMHYPCLLNLPLVFRPFNYV